MERFFTHSPDLLATASIRHGRWKRVNPAFTRTLGWTEKELMAMPFLELVHPDHMERSRRALERLAERQPITQFEIRVRSKDGTYRWIAWEVRNDGEGDLVFATGRDVTDRKAAEEELRRSEARERARAGELEAMMEAFPAIVFLSRDPECRDMAGSRATYELLRVPYGRNISATAPEGERLDRFRLMMDGRDVPPRELPMQRAAATGKPVRDYELEVVFSEGDDKMLLGNAVPLFNEDGRVYGAVSAFLDITERKRGEDRLRSTLESIGDGFFALDGDWRFVYVNTPAEGMLGIGREEMIGKQYWNLFPFIRGTRIESEYRRAAAGHIVEFDTFYEPWSRWFHHRCFPRFGGGMTVYFRDITENKQMEADLRREQELFQTIFTSVPIMLTVYDPSLNMVHLNKSLYDLTGWTEPEVREHGIMELVYPDPDYREWVAAYMQSLQPGFQDIRMACKDGRILETAWANIQISDGRQVGIGIDMTERKEMEEALRRLNRTLEDRVAERSALAEARAEQLEHLTGELIDAEERERRRIADLLHDDLQQLLAGARMQLRALAKDLPAHPPVLESVGRLLEESIGKTRHLSHELSPVGTRDAGFVGALERLARNMEERFGLEVRLAAETTAPLENPSVQTFLYRAVNELLFNTYKHAGVKTADVALSRTDGALILTVSDSGKGFDQALVRSSDASTGLGLRSMRERARYFGGSLEIESAPGRGSRFTLTLPLAAPGPEKT